MKGLQVTVEHTTPTPAPRDSSATSSTPPIPRAPTPTPPPAKGQHLRRLFRQAGRLAGRALDPRGSAAYAIAADHNTSIPDNLYLIPSAGASPAGPEPQDDDDDAMDADGPGSKKTLWTRGGDAWWPAARKRAAVDAPPEAYDAVFADTDHLAACVLTKLALATCPPWWCLCPSTTGISTVCSRTSPVTRS